jgi:hypothetical protein
MAIFRASRTRHNEYSLTLLATSLNAVMLVDVFKLVDIFSDGRANLKVN